MLIAPSPDDPSKRDRSYARRIVRGARFAISANIGIISIASNATATIPTVVYNGAPIRQIFQIAETAQQLRQNALAHMSRESGDAISIEDILCGSGSKPSGVARINDPNEPDAFSVCVKAAVVSASNTEATTKFYNHNFQTARLTKDDVEVLPIAIMQAVVFVGKNADGKYILNLDSHSLVMDLPDSLIAQAAMMFGAFTKDIPITPEDAKANNPADQQRFADDQKLLDEINSKVKNNFAAITNIAIDIANQSKLNPAEIYVAAFKMGQSAALHQ